MATEDAVRWNKRYEGMPRGWYSSPRKFLVDHLDALPEHGLALDVAMGPGQNVSALLERGLDVIGVDISSTAAAQAKERNPNLMAVVADLEHFYLPAAAFDVITNFYYLQRALFREFVRILKPGGLILFETLTQDMLQTRPDIDPLFLLAPGELKERFWGWEILFYHEGWVTGDHGNSKAIASMVARLPTNGSKDSLINERK